MENETVTNYLSTYPDCYKSKPYAATRKVKDKKDGPFAFGTSYNSQRVHFNRFGGKKNVMQRKDETETHSI